MPEILSIMPLFVPMLGFMFVAAFTPGPNNIMLAASGANFGFLRTNPHMFGVTAGFGFLLILAGFGLDQVFRLWPWSQNLFRVMALAFILWLAWKIATAKRGGGKNGDAKNGGHDANVSKPLNFWQAASFQFINPKALAMSVSVISTYINPDGEAFVWQFLILAVSFTTITHLSTMTWAAFGVVIRQFIQTPLRFRAFNIIMAVLLIVSILPVAKDLFA